MSRGRKTSRLQETTQGSRTSRPVVATALKWVGGVSAVLSLIFGLHQLVDMISGQRQRQRQVKELLSISRMQQQAGDFGAAWTSLEQADRLSKGASDVRAAQETLAMDWLENAHVNPDQQKFGDIVGKAAPVLDRAVSSAAGVRKANILAHLGWAEFLRSRDGPSAAAPDRYYRQALQVDPQNAYAHAMLGHGMLWKGGPVSEAREEFALAQAPGPWHGFVRSLQLSAYEDRHTEEADRELIKVVNDMRKNGEPVDSHTRSTAWLIYNGNLDSPSARRQQFLAVMPPEEQLATFGWLFDTVDFDPSRVWIREYDRAILQEAAGQRTDALQTLLAVRAQLPGLAPGRIRDQVEKGIARLSKAQ